jgi:DNA-binding XRE family transcriptional regulator
MNELEEILNNICYKEKWILMKNFKNLKEKARQNEIIKQYLDSFTSKMGTEIFKLRVNNKMTQKELAELANVTQATISRIEAGDPGIKGETYDKVLKALKVTIHLDTQKEQSSALEKHNQELVGV